MPSEGKAVGKRGGFVLAQIFWCLSVQSVAQSPIV